MRDLENHFGRDCIVKRIKACHCEGLKQALLARKLSDGNTLSTRSVKDRFELYQRIWDWAIRMDYIDSNPFRKLTALKVTLRRKRDAFDAEETSRLLATAREQMPWFYPLVLVAAITGSRRGPLPLMEVRDFDAP